MAKSSVGVSQRGCFGPVYTSWQFSSQYWWLAVVRKNAIHVCICHSCGMTVERGRRRVVFSPASLSTVLEFLTLWHVSVPTTHLQKTPLTDMTCKITQEIWGGMSLLSPSLPLGSPEKASSDDIRSPGETVVSIWQPQTFSSLVAAVLQNHFWS